jgi:hypothetical protein
VRFLFPKDFIGIWHFYPLTWETLTTQVLILTAASLLISQDLNIPVRDAAQVLVDSTQFGNAAHPDNEDDLDSPFNQLSQSILALSTAPGVYTYNGEHSDLTAAQGVSVKVEELPMGIPGGSGSRNVPDVIDLTEDD